SPCYCYQQLQPWFPKTSADSGDFSEFAAHDSVFPVGQIIAAAPRRHSVTSGTAPKEMYFEDWHSEVVQVGKGLRLHRAAGRRSRRLRPLLEHRRLRLP